MKKINGIIGATLALVVVLSGCKKPTASFTADKSEAEIGEVVTFTNTSADAGTYTWDFGDGTSSTKSSPTHAYSKAGEYSVTLTSAKVNGKKAIEAAAMKITVKKIKDPVSIFTASKSSAMPGEVITFTSASTDADEFIYDFGDGSGSNSPTATHVYGSGGTYTVSLTVYSHARTLRAVSTTTISIGNATGDFATKAALVGSWKITSHDLTHTVSGATVPACGSIYPQPYTSPFLFAASATPKITLTANGSIYLYDNDGNVHGSNGNYNVIDASKMNFSHGSLYNGGGNTTINKTAVPEVNYNNGMWKITTLNSSTLTLTNTYTIVSGGYTNNCVSPVQTGSGVEVITETVSYTKQ